MSHHIKRILFRFYAPISVAAFGLAIFLSWHGKLEWKQFAATVGGIYAFAFSVQKQNLEEIKLFKQLSEQFNGRYDEMNGELNRIYFDKQPADKPFTDTQRETLYKYFNLCGEEWLYTEKGFICKEVWESWANGMKFFAEIGA